MDLEGFLLEWRAGVSMPNIVRGLNMPRVEALQVSPLRLGSPISWVAARVVTKWFKLGSGLSEEQKVLIKKVHPVGDDNFSLKRVSELADFIGMEHSLARKINLAALAPATWKKSGLYLGEEEEKEVKCIRVEMLKHLKYEEELEEWRNIHPPKAETSNR